MIRVYAYEACLELTKLPPGAKGLPTTQVLPKERPARLIYLPSTLEKVRSYHLQAASHNKTATITLYFPTEEAIQHFWEGYKATFHNIFAGGAVVMDAGGQILFIWRRGRWDLPKGKGEPNEPLELTAQRELKEETGLDCGKPERFLTSTYHIYAEGGQYILKQTHWYLFKCPLVAPDIHVQADEGIQGYKWVPPHEVPFLYPQSYGTIRDVIEHVLREIRPAPSP
ncbi:MAG: NUDIX domain-containing protein [Bacteroidia bacterium]|nr:NUDIX domain-containing protein [Bacteroidia bacterium]MCX7764217.1 NUDIX domain-containing protein [Bacteroidia bacterium]MDW8056893.1 NUDIX domain-containing protein [Bacteroidia bacterium]